LSRRVSATAEFVASTPSTRRQLDGLICAQVSLTGIRNYAEGVARLFGDDARCEVIACAPRGEDIAVDWRLSGSVRVGPGATIKPYVVHTTFRVRDGLVVFQEDAFSIPGWQILLGVLLPGLPIPEPAPPVEELRRRAGT